MSIIDDYTKQMCECYRAVSGSTPHISITDFIKLRKEAIKEVNAGFNANIESVGEKAIPISFQNNNMVPNIHMTAKQQPASETKPSAKVAAISQHENHPLQEEPDEESAFSLLKRIPDNWN